MSSTMTTANSNGNLSLRGLTSKERGTKEMVVQNLRRASSWLPSLERPKDGPELRRFQQSKIPLLTRSPIASYNDDDSDSDNDNEDNQGYFGHGVSKMPQPYKRGLISTNGRGQFHICPPATQKAKSPPPRSIRTNSGEPIKSSLKSSSSSTTSTVRSRAKSEPVAVSQSSDMAPAATACPPAQASKTVHFDQQLEYVKWFLATQKPLAVSRDGLSPYWETSEGDSTTDTTTTMGLGTRRAGYMRGAYPFPVMGQRQKANTPSSLKLRPISVPTSLIGTSSAGSDPWQFHVRLDSLTLTTPTTNTTSSTTPVKSQQATVALTGTVLVLNVAYSKNVSARFTLDNWSTISEVAASHVCSLRSGQYDKFEFHIPLPMIGEGDRMDPALLAGKRMEVCVRYCVPADGQATQVWWDSNGGRNYVVEFECAAGTAVRTRLSTTVDVQTTNRRIGGQYHRRKNITYSIADDEEGEDQNDDAELEALARRPGQGAPVSLKGRYDFLKSFQHGTPQFTTQSQAQPSSSSMPFNKPRRMTLPLSCTTTTTPFRTTAHDPEFTRARGSPREVTPEWVADSYSYSDKYIHERETTSSTTVPQSEPAHFNFNEFLIPFLQSSGLVSGLALRADSGVDEGFEVPTTGVATAPWSILESGSSSSSVSIVNTGMMTLNADVSPKFSAVTRRRHEKTSYEKKKKKTSSFLNDTPLSSPSSAFLAYSKAMCEAAITSVGDEYATSTCTSQVGSPMNVKMTPPSPSSWALAVRAIQEASIMECSDLPAAHIDHATKSSPWPRHPYSLTPSSSSCSASDSPSGLPDIVDSPESPLSFESSLTTPPVSALMSPDVRSPTADSEDGPEPGAREAGIGPCSTHISRLRCCQS